MKDQEDIQRKLGILAKYAATGALTGVPDTLGFALNAPTYLTNALGAKGEAPYEYLGPKLLKKIDEVTGNKYQPEGFGEKALGNIAEFLTAGKATALPKAASKIGEFIAPRSKEAYAALAGAGAGTAAGQEYFPDDPMMQLILGLGGGFAPGAAKGAVNVAKNPVAAAGKALGVNPEKVQAFNEAGLKPTLANVSDSRAVQIGQNIARNVPLAGKPINDAIKSNLETVEKLGQGLSQGEAGELAQLALRAGQKQGRELASAKKLDVDKYLKPDTAIPTTKLTEVSAKLTPQLATPAARAEFQNSRIGKEIEKFEQAAQNGFIPYGDYAFFRQNIDDAITTFGLLGNKTQGALKAIRGAIQEDIGNHVKQVGPEAAKAWEGYNKFYTQFRNHNDDVVEGLLKNKSATQTFKSIANNLKVDGIKAKATLEALPKDQQQVFSQALIKELGSNNQNVFTGSAFARRFNGLEPEVRALVLQPFDKGTQKQYKALMKTAEAIEETAKLANNSHSATHGLSVSGGLSGWYFPLETLIGLTGGLAASKFMTSPKLINWMSDSLKATTPKEATDSLKKLNRLAVTSPELLPAISQFTQDLDVAQDLSPQERAELQELRELSDEEFAEYEQLSNLSDEELLALEQQNSVVNPQN